VAARVRVRWRLGLGLMAATLGLGDSIYWSDFEWSFILSFHGF
jgi:hypothetical protein